MQGISFFDYGQIEQGMKLSPAPFHYAERAAKYGVRHA
jgi:hypothetical protein